jgi:RNA polymerase-binding transcription factor DksA
MNSVVPVSRKLFKRSQDIVSRLERVQNDVRHTSGLSADFEEQATEQENDDVLHRLDTLMRAELACIDRALARIQKNRYGTCERCNKPISPVRLDALPYTTRCGKCAEAIAPRTRRCSQR